MDKYDQKSHMDESPKNVETLKHVKVSLPDDIEDKARRKAGALFGARKGAFSKAVSKALIKWMAPIDPEISVGTTPGGMYFEIPEKYVKIFLIELAREVNPKKVVYSYLEGNQDVELECTAQEIEEKLADLETVLLDPSFMGEYDEVRIYTGGSGCFSVQADFTPQEKRNIARKILEKMEITIEIDATEFHIAIRNGTIEVFG